MSEHKAKGKAKKQQLEDYVESFILQLKRRQLRGSFIVAKRTAELMRVVIKREKFSEGQALVAAVQRLGRRLQEAQPLELATGNIVRRVLFSVREETRRLHARAAQKDQAAAAACCEGDAPAQSGVLRILTAEDPSECLNLHIASEDVKALKEEIVGSIDELVAEIDNMYTSFADQTKATELIHSNDVIFIHGKSDTVLQFLASASKRLSFEVIAAEAAPACDGQDAAAELCRAGVVTTVISDCMAFALMGRVNKVMVGAHAILANGGVLAQAGAHAVAIAARAHAVPFVVCTGLYKLSPIYPNNLDALADLQSPSALIPYNEVTRPELTEIENPSFDYIPPELVSLFLTNDGRHTPSFLYRMLAEYYHPDDRLD
eukprot:m51a1_g7057 putative translation initiation factor eif-2b subunit beta (375) ;mRNA; r:165523-167180